MKKEEDIINDKEDWTKPVFLILNARETQSGSSVNKDSEDDEYTFVQLS